MASCRAMIATLGLGLALIPQAHAHPTLVRSEPPAGAKEKAPAGVALYFSEKIQPVFNKIEVTDARGVRCEDGKALLDTSDRSVLRISLKPLQPGSYLVKWRAAGTDSHPMEGSFRFEVTN